MRRFLPILTVVVVSLSATPVMARSISDPREFMPYHRDIRTATLLRPRPGALTWTTVTWDRWSIASLGPYRLELDLDVEGTAKEDLRVVVGRDINSGDLYCDVKRADGSFMREGVGSRPNRRTVSCRFSTADFGVRKAIHWRMRSSSVWGTDRAPNSGWVKGV